MSDAQELHERPAELQGPQLEPLPAATLWEALTRAPEASTQPWLLFEGDERRALTRADATFAALHWAHALATTVRREQVERVGLLLPNGPDFVSVFFAAQALGAAAVPLAWPVVDGDVARVHAQLAATVSRARLDVLVTTPSLAGAPWGVPVLTHPLARCGLAQATPSTGGPAFLQFTSGSTGAPRGVVISQRAALSSAVAMGQALALGPDDVGVSWLPFFHDMGLVGVLLTSLVRGFRVHVQRPGDFLFRPRRWLELASRERATLLVGPNFAWDLVCRRVSPDGLDLSSVRCALNGSEPVHRATLSRFASTFAPAGFRGEAMLPVYGLAEATLGVCFARPGLPRGDALVDGRPVPSVGEPLPGTRVCVVDALGERVAEGVEGEVCVQSPSVMSGYFDDAAATGVALREGWLRTGDLGLVREGALFVTGREKELVIQQGRKFHPYDIERVVSELVDATPNGVAAVTRVHPESGHEELVVIAELRRQSSALEPAAVRGALLARLGVRADEVEFVPAGRLPRTTSGKVQRRMLARPRVLILGAGGFLGLNAARAFLDARITPSCGRRARGNVLGLRALKTPQVVTDFTDVEALTLALTGTEVLVHCAAHYPRFSHTPDASLQQGLRELDAVLEAAARARVRRLVFVSSTATVAPRADGRASSEADVFSTAPPWGTYHSLKWALEQRVLGETRFEVTVANPAACMGPADWKVGTSALLLATARGAPPPHPAGLVSTVDARDVGTALVRLACMSQPPRRLILSGQTDDAHDFLERVARRYGAPQPPPALPADDAKALADAQEHEAARTKGRAALPRELVDLIVHAPALDTALARQLGLRFRPIEDTLVAWDTWARRMGFLSHDAKALS